MGNVSSCYKSNNRLDTCTTPGDEDERAPNSGVSYEVQDEKADRPAGSQENPQETGPTQGPAASPKAISGPTKTVTTPSTPLLHSGSGNRSEGGNYGGDH
ncbi:hypothetical protein KRP22_009909 [Phytophthora ramorum]|uniref:uncharacterized protein n=1 Tax=Phytophthora ramorum TaxID=164328 RepID=UPI0030A94457|nr:hypothetical protein KRP23_6802 [Phytophthora ramorum]KAH7500837.1 hypothetical protein KRP22_10082 [Phytophthora ramorum]